MPTPIATLGLDTTTGAMQLDAVSFTANTDGFLCVQNLTTSAQPIKADCYANGAIAYSYSGTFGVEHYLFIPIDTTIQSVTVTVNGAVGSPLPVNLIGKNEMSTVTIAANGTIAGPDGTANVTCTGAALSVVNQSRTEYYAFLGGNTPGYPLPPGVTTSLPITTADYLQFSSSTAPTGGAIVNVRHVDKSVVVINYVNGVQAAYPAIILPSANYVYLVNISTADAGVWMQGYLQGVWTKIPLTLPPGGVYRGDMSEFDNPANPPNPAPPNYQVSLGFEISDDPIIAIKRPTTGA